MIKEIYEVLKDDLDKIATDSRVLQAGDIFLTLKGDRFNGNDFVDSALSKGVKFVIADETSILDDRIILVPNAYLFLIMLAKHHRTQFKAQIIAITGTNGKTSSKELISHIFQKKYNTIATYGNLNNHIGVPLTLLRIKREHEFLILEMGANKIGDIAELCEISDPDTGLITNVGKAHLEGFGNETGVLNAKTELFNYLEERKKFFFLNYNSEPLFSIKHFYTKFISYGNKSKGAQYQFELVYSIPSILCVDYSSPIKYEFHSILFGEHNFENLMAAITVAHHYKIPNELIQLGIDSYVPNNMRSQIFEYKENTIILDAYNANPSSMHMAISSADQYPHKAKWLILGSMAELGIQSPKEHAELLDYVKTLKIEKVILVGKEFESARGYGWVQWFNNTADCKLWLEDNFPIGKLILIKGSRSIGLEKLVIN